MAANMDALTAAQEAARRNGRPDHGEYAITFDAKGRPVLPAKPAADDLPGLCRWAAGAFNLDTDHPITSGVRQGSHTSEGHLELRRAGAPPIRFEPIARLTNPTKMRETLEGCALHTDGEIPGFTSAHTYTISHVLRVLCGHCELISTETETMGLLSSLLVDARPVEGLTAYGTGGQRYEAAVALQRTPGDYGGTVHYLIDANTGEHVVRVGDLLAAGRRQLGSVPRGWVDARMAAIGWRRLELQGHALGSGGRRRGAHARCAVYVGHLPADTDDAGDS